MKILWIEDFGRPLSRSEIIEEIFGEFFTEVDLGEEYDEDKGDTGEQLSSLFAKYTLHEICVCESYVEWKQIDAQHSGDFDVVLIDISLVSSATPAHERPAGIENPGFDQKAGFYIYHQLIKRGFPDDNIAFFTAEGHSLKEFSKYCGDIFLDQPAHCFQKNSTQFKQLRRWLAEKASQQSLILRRGVIEGCRFMKEKVAAIDTSDLESQLLFYKTTPRNVASDPESFRRETVDYLTRLERFFLLHESRQRSDLLSLFIKELAGKWQDSKGDFVWAKGTPHFDSWTADQFHRTAQLLLKLLRNWSTHELLPAGLTVKEAAYFFMLAMRSWVETDLTEIFKYEQLLSTLFSKLSDLELNRRMNSELGFYLERSYEQLRALHADVSKHVLPSTEQRRGPNTVTRRIDNYFLALFRELQEAKLKWEVLGFYQRRFKDESVKLFYHSFWHGLFPVQIKTTFYANLQAVKFNIDPLPDSFISFLGQSIYEECFKNGDVVVEVA